MTAKPAISIVIPFYNVEKYLAECLKSVSNQDFRDFEVLMIDDGSPDHSARIAKRFARKDKRFRYICQDNAGLGAARNTGLAHSSADLIMWMDSDDILLQGCLSKTVPLMLSGQDDFVTFGVYRYSERSQRLLHSPLQQRIHGDDLRHINPFQCPFIFRDSTAWNKVFRKSFFKEHVGRWEEGVLFEDLFPVCRAVCAAKSISVISEKYYVWRARAEGTSITQKRSDTQAVKDRFLALTQIAGHLKKQTAEVQQRFLEKFFSVDYPIYRSLVGKGDDNYDSVFLEQIKAFVDVLDFDLIHSAAITPDQKLVSQYIANLSADQIGEIQSSDLFAPLRRHYGPKQIQLASDRADIALPTYDLGETERPDVIKFQKVDIGEDEARLRYVITTLPAHDPITDVIDHTFVLELEKSGYRRFFQPALVHKDKGFFKDQVMQTFEVSIPYQELVATDRPSDFNYGRYWRKKVFRVAILKRPDVSTRIQSMRFGQPTRLYHVDHKQFDSITFHATQGVGSGCTLRRKPSIMRLLGQIVERASRISALRRLTRS